MANEKIVITADGKKRVKLSMNTTKFEKSLEKAENQLKDFTNSPFEAVLGLEDNATTAIRRVTMLASSFANTTYKVTLSIDATKATSGINMIKRQLDGLKLNIIQRLYRKLYTFCALGTQLSGNIGIVKRCGKMSAICN